MPLMSYLLTYKVVLKIFSFTFYLITHPPVTASPLDERRGEVPTRSFFDLSTGGVLFVRRREVTRKATKPIAKGLAVTLLSFLIG